MVNFFASRKKISLTLKIILYDEIEYNFIFYFIDILI